MKKIIKSTISILMLSLLPSAMMASDMINLAGKWTYKVDQQRVGQKEKFYLSTFENQATLPASADEIGIGEVEKVKDPMNALQRRHYYVGMVWYQKQVDIPSDWKDKNIELFLERCHWITDVWVDDKYVGQKMSLNTPNTFDLTNFLTPGKHKITVLVDNKLKFQLGGFASSISEHTQTNWNGMVGKMFLRKTDKLWIDSAKAFSSSKDKKVDFEIHVKNDTNKPLKAKARVQINLRGSSQEIKKDFDISAPVGESVAKVTVDGLKNIELWSEFNPKMYDAKVSITANNMLDSKDVSFAFRDIEIKDNMFVINGKKIYLRGNLECAIFPLTGYPPMEASEWERILLIMKSNGLNHIRFHSWGPPDAAFEAADNVGFYLQSEAPRANIDNSVQERTDFIHEEMLAMNKYYGNHPSFLMSTTGNELHSDVGINEAIVIAARKDDNRRFYSKTTGGFGMDQKYDPSKSDDFKVGGVRGIINQGTNADQRGRIAKAWCPTVSHEVGQWVVFPNFNDIDKYTGVLNPINLITLKETLIEKGLFDQWEEFFDVTKHQTATLYKEEIEVLLRTPKHAGFQMLQLQDYPGQGTAHVGLYNALWESKGAITPEAFSRFCSDVVPLLRMPKRSYLSNETFVATVELFNYSADDIKKATPEWVIRNSDKKVIASGKLATIDIPQGGTTQLGEISVPLSFVKDAQKLNIEITLDNHKAANDWNFWCYPAELPAIKEDKKYEYVTDYKSLKKAIAQKKTILFNPEKEYIKAGVKGAFKPCYWSPVWYWSRVTHGGGNMPMGIICDTKHKAMANFPSEVHTNWQWWDPLGYSRPMIIDTLPKDLKPIVQLVDNFWRNHKLADIFEANVAGAKVLFCSIDLSDNLVKKSVGIRQLRYSLENYVNSADFKPKSKLSISDLDTIFSEEKIVIEDPKKKTKK